MSDVSERMERMRRDLEGKAQKAAELKSAMDDIQGRATSADETVTVLAAPSGAVLDLQLSPQVTRGSHTAIQRTIMATIREAAQDAAQQVNDVAEPVLGDQYEQFRDMFKQDTDSTTGSASRTTSSDDEDDNFEDGSFLV